jgi:hypothetical protein
MSGPEGGPERGPDKPRKRKGLGSSRKMPAEQYDSDYDSDAERESAEFAELDPAFLLAIDDKLAAEQWENISEKDIIKHLVDDENKRREKRRKGFLPPKPLCIDAVWDDKSQDWKAVDGFSLPNTWERLQILLASYHVRGP